MSIQSLFSATYLAGNSLWPCISCLDADPKGTGLRRVLDLERMRTSR